MQLPRGNLETVQSRIPVLYVIKECLEKGDYKNAFLECRKNRINTNLVYDLIHDKFNPKSFLEQLGKVFFLPMIS